jgi:hypothetical protein
MGGIVCAAAQVHLYTATLASRLTQQRLANDIKSKADLPGKPVETWCAPDHKREKKPGHAAAGPLYG